jgi:transposase InsO family protein
VKRRHFETLMSPRVVNLFVRSTRRATLEWVDWFNTRRLLEPIGYAPPAEYEAASYQQTAVA